MEMGNKKYTLYTITSFDVNDDIVVDVQEPYSKVHNTHTHTHVCIFQLKKVTCSAVDFEVGRQHRLIAWSAGIVFVRHAVECHFENVDSVVVRRVGVFLQELSDGSLEDGHHPSHAL
jgi:hypothetical protein